MIHIKQILEIVPSYEYIGKEECVINDIVQLDNDNKRDDVIYWCNDKNIDKLKDCFHGIIICSVKVKESAYINPSANYIIVENPRLIFANILKTFFIPEEDKFEISEKAVIHPSVKIGKNVFIGANNVIEKDCIIGDNTSIGYNNTIYKKTKIGSNVKIGSNNTIGGIGFGYEKDEEGNYQLLNHIGNVVINDYVEIGNNTCIDKAVLGSTIINKNAKIDNLVHIAHGVIIGDNSLIIANSMIGGSAVIGKNVWISPSVSILNKAIVEDNSLVGMGAVVVKNVESDTIVVGNPAKFLKKNS